MLPGSVRSIFVPLLGFPLLMLLALTTPIGTGQGVHRTLALHPLFSHTHVVDGQIVWHHQADLAAAEAQQPTDTAGPSIGAAAGASLATHVVAISSTLPFQDWRLEPDRAMRHARPSGTLPIGRVEAPPDPPPTFGA
jgi:hypothetical protein